MRISRSSNALEITPDRLAVEAHRIRARAAARSRARSSRASRARRYLLSPSFALGFGDQARQRVERRTIVVARRDNAPAQEFPAVGRKRDDLGLRAAQVDAEPHRWLQSRAFRSSAARPFDAASWHHRILQRRSFAAAKEAPRALYSIPRHLHRRNMPRRPARGGSRHSSISFVSVRRRIGASSSPTSSERRPASRSRWWLPPAVARRSRRLPSRRASRKATSGSADRPEAHLRGRKVRSRRRIRVADGRAVAAVGAEGRRAIEVDELRRPMHACSASGTTPRSPRRRSSQPPACWKDLIKPGYAGEVHIADPSAIRVDLLRDRRDGAALRRRRRVQVSEGDVQGTAAASEDGTWSAADAKGRHSEGSVPQGSAQVAATLPAMPGGGKDGGPRCLSRTRERRLRSATRSRASASSAMSSPKRRAARPMKVIAPCEGTIYEVSALSIVKGARNLDNAKKFVDWALGAKAQALAAKAKHVRVSGEHRPLPLHRSRRSSARSSSSATTSPDSRNRLSEGVSSSGGQSEFGSDSP